MLRLRHGFAPVLLLSAIAAAGLAGCHAGPAPRWARVAPPIDASGAARSLVLRPDAVFGQTQPVAQAPPWYAHRLDALPRGYARHDPAR
ncbi:MAG: hypothetical protein AAGA57_04640 [Planctomycetota bacterium]